MEQKIAKRECFTFYISFEEAVSCLDDHDELIMRRAISNYALYEEMPDLTGPLMGMFLSWKPNIDASNKRRDASSENGKKGGRSRKDENLEKPSHNLEKPSHNLEKPSHNLEKGNININVNTKKNLNEKENLNTGSAGPDSRSRPCKEVDVDIETEKEKMFTVRYRPLEEDLVQPTEEEIQRKNLLMQRVLQEARK